MFYALLYVCFIAVGVWLIEYLFEPPAKVCTVLRVLGVVLAIYVLFSSFPR